MSLPYKVIRVDYIKKKKRERERGRREEKEELTYSS
jgi:hypothetical protein